MTRVFFLRLPVEVFSADSCFPQRTVTPVVAHTGLALYRQWQVIGLGFPQFSVVGAW